MSHEFLFWSGMIFGVCSLVVYGLAIFALAGAIFAFLTRKHCREHRITTMLLTNPAIRHWSFAMCSVVCMFSLYLRPTIAVGIALYLLAVCYARIERWAGKVVPE